MALSVSLCVCVYVCWFSRGVRFRIQSKFQVASSVQPLIAATSCVFP